MSSPATVRSSRRTMPPRRPVRNTTAAPEPTGCRVGRPSRCAALTPANEPIGSYRDGDGRRRELIAVPGALGSTIVLDRDAATLADRRLVAHLGADEPPENAVLVARHYLDDPAGRWCRSLRPADLQTAPPGEEPSSAIAADGAPEEAGDGRWPSDADRLESQAVVEAGNWRYGLRAMPGERSSLQLRWCRRHLDPTAGEWEQVSLREIVGTLERYEPMRTITARALANRRADGEPLLRRLRSEHERLCASPIVLNRRLREAVLCAVERDGHSLSELALRCGVVKRDARGRVSGETSWLARRVGLMAEGGRAAPTPWIHSDVLALIARRALRVSPREVEVL